VVSPEIRVWWLGVSPEPNAIPPTCSLLMEARRSALLSCLVVITDSMATAWVDLIRFLALPRVTVMSVVITSNACSSIAWIAEETQAYFSLNYMTEKMNSTLRSEELLKSHCFDWRRYHFLNGFTSQIKLQGKVKSDGSIYSDCVRSVSGVSTLSSVIAAEPGAGRLSSADGSTVLKKWQRDSNTSWVLANSWWCCKT